jgi:hypothetical protein
MVLGLSRCIDAQNCTATEDSLRFDRVILSMGDALGIRLGITAYRHAPILQSLLRQRPLLDARAQTIDVTYLIY